MGPVQPGGSLTKELYKNLACVLGSFSGGLVLSCSPAKKYCVDSGVVLQPPIPLHTMGQKRCLWTPRMGVSETHDAKSIVWVLGWRSNHPHRCTPWARKGVFGYLRWGCLNCTMPKKLLGFLGGAPNTHTCAHHGPEKVFLDTWDGGV